MVIKDQRVDDVSAGVLLDNAGRSAMFLSDPTENRWIDLRKKSIESLVSRCLADIRTKMTQADNATGCVFRRSLNWQNPSVSSDLWTQRICSITISLSCMLKIPTILVRIMSLMAAMPVVVMVMEMPTVVVRSLVVRSVLKARVILFIFRLVYLFYISFKE